MNSLIKVLQLPGIRDKTFPSLFVPKNVLSKLHISFDSAPSGYMGSMIYWSIDTVAFGTISYLNRSSLKNSTSIHKHG